jgi:hypothetical protein
MKSATAVLGIATIVGVVSFQTVTPAQERNSICRPDGQRERLAGIPEASGVAVGSRPSRLWIVSDSGAPVLHGADPKGGSIERVAVSGAKVTDWEDITMAACPAGRCLYIGDIGDNDRKRPQITVYRVPEPAPGVTSVAADAFHAVYPDGPHDAESLFVDAGGRINVVTKTRPSVIYRFPASPAPGSRSRLEQVASLAVGGSVTTATKKGRRNDGEPATGAAVSPDGQWVAIRSNHLLTFVPMKELRAGAIQSPLQVDLTPLGEPQGEGIAFASDSTLYLVGESGEKSGAGTLTRIACTLPH